MAAATTTIHHSVREQAEVPEQNKRRRNSKIVILQ